MNRVAILALVLLAIAGGAAWYTGILGGPTSRIDVALTLYDTNASGHADLTRERIGEQATIWRWDRDDDG